MVVAMLILLIPMSFIMGYLSVKFIHGTTLTNSIKYMQQLTGQINYNIDTYIKYMENISFMLKNNSDVKRFLTLDITDEEQALAKNRAVEQIRTILKVREDICNIGVIGTNGRYILNNDEKINSYIDVKEKFWYKRALEKKEGFMISSSHVQNIVEYKYPWVVSLSSAITEDDNNIGVLLVDLNYKVIDNLCKGVQLDDNSYIFLIDENGSLVYHPNQNLIYSGLKTERINEVLSCKESFFIAQIDEEEYLYTIAKSETTGWRAVGVVKMKDLLVYNILAKNMYLIVTATIVIIAILLSIHLSKKITKPIRALEDAMRKSELGEFEAAEIEILETNEIGRLGKTFNIMNKKIQQLIEEKVQDEKLKRKSELKALQAQINPHFLYNTLDSIIWMAEGGKNKEVVKMTAQLARLLRQSISNGLESVSIKQEMSYVNNYLSIQKMRYRDQLSYTLDIAESIEQYRIIKLLLQPLIENAIYHGIKYKEGGGSIFVKGYEENDKIIFEINDDGVGMDEETLSNIFKEKEVSVKRNGVGVYNVYSRLKLHYGQEGDIFYASSLNQGTKVKILIPKEQEGEPL